MNRKRIREDILANLDQLPASFIDAEYYNQKAECYCLYGWLCVVTGGPDPREYLIWNYEPVTRYLTGRYGLSNNISHLYDADRLVRTIGKYDPDAHLDIAPAQEVVDTYINLHLGGT